MLDYLTFSEYFTAAYLVTFLILVRIPSSLPLGRELVATAWISVFGFIIWPIAIFVLLGMTFKRIGR